MSAGFDINGLTDHLFRRESGKMVAVLTRIFGTENLELSEDVVQETFIGALRVWRLKGLPENPSAWLFRAAKNRAIDILRKNRFSVQFDFSDPERSLLRSGYTLTSAMEKLWRENEIADDLLRMMFACCENGISPENQITLILKTLCGFSTAEIARAFVTSEDTISKRLYRTKEFFRIRKIKPAFPEVTEIKKRTEAVLKTIYLLFNEGYSATHADEVIRKELLDQAMYLCSLLCQNPHTNLPETNALMALMSFHAARTGSRLSAEGEVILLAGQDRSKWDRSLIAQGNDYMNRAASGDRITAYHIEAAIAFEHCTAETFGQTNWRQILIYYDWLVKINPAAVVSLNRMAVVFKIYGAAQALDEMRRSPHREAWEDHYLYHSLLGEIYTEADKAKAKACFEKAVTLTHSPAEKKLLQKRIRQLNAG